MNVEGSALGDEGVLLLRVLFQMIDFLECRNAEASVLGDVDVPFLRDYLKSKTF